jgi:hypothetical protein
VIVYGPSPDAEARALRRAAARCGCTVRELATRETTTGPRAVGRVDCPDGWAAARMLVALAVEDARQPWARDVALALRRNAPSDEAFARAVQAFVKDRVRFVREAGEVFQGGAYTLESGGGDCDDHARLAMAIALAGGLPSAMAFLHHGGLRSSPTHAAVQLCPGNVCSWAETTVDAAFGEHPLAAAIRLGLVNERQDLAREVRVMTERDLPPPPKGYEAANPEDRLVRDAEALTILGFLSADWPTWPETAKASDTAFRAGVAKAQRSLGGLVVDGLIGPKTRAALARALPSGDFATRYLGSIGGAASGLTADLPDAFFVDMKRYAAELGFDPVWMLDVMFSESGLRATAAYRNPPHLATGLIGFVDIKRYGAVPDNSLESHDAFAKLPPTTQLRFARDFWLPLKGKAERAANLYQYAFLPASLARGTADDTVLAAKGGTGYRGQEGMFYNLNFGYLDVDKDDAITVRDLAERLEMSKRTKGGALLPRYAEALQRLNAATPAGPSTGAASGGAAIAGLVVLGIGAAAFAWWNA